MGLPGRKRHICQPGPQVYGKRILIEAFKESNDALYNGLHFPLTRCRPRKHTCVIETGMSKHYSILVANQSQAIEQCKKLITENGVRAITLCPGFTNQNVDEIADVAGNKIAVAVARGDSPGAKLTGEILRKGGWIK
ncbi:DUF6506 family protein [Chloroflexota bacterium]